MEQFSSAGEIYRHAAFAGLVLPFLLTNVAWLRVAATVGGLLLISYIIHSGGDATTATLWGAALVAVNGFRLYELYRSKTETLATLARGEDDPMLRLALSGLNDTQISRLMKAAEVRECDKGAVLTKQGKPVNSLFFLYSGKANVEVGGAAVAALDSGAFIGEIAYLTGKPATATVVVDRMSRVLTFSRERLNKVVAEDPHISGIIYELLGRDLASKMGRANSQRSHDEPAHTRI
ncbi:MAG: cyclic nucleotide-binding domain-containing protein [Hyphomicrobiales bacterium]|jgi:CRP-like cAMP-binding protein